MVNNKHVFWQAFVIASLIFWIGILIGVFFENQRTQKLEDVYSNYETELFDFELYSDIIFNSNFTCNHITKESIILADKIYAEALKLEKYDTSNKITKDLIQLHKRYDLLRTMLWNNIIQTNKKCNLNINTVIYLYKYDNPSLTTKGIQGAMSNLLIDLKEKHKNKIILIPIAIDTEVKSLELMKKNYGITTFPSIFINQKHLITELKSLEYIEKYLKE